MSEQVGWILVHSATDWDEQNPPQPALEKRIDEDEPWNWGSSEVPPMKPDGKSHSLLLAWRNVVWAEGSAEIVERTSDEYSYAFHFTEYIPGKGVRLQEELGVRPAGSLVKLTDALLKQYHQLCGK